MKMKKFTALAALMLGALAVILSSGVGVCAKEISDDEYVTAALPSDVKVSSRILEFLFGKGKAQDNGSKNEPVTLLCPGGDVFGVRIKEGRVSVAASGITAVSAGDFITSINGKSVRCIEDVKAVLGSFSGGDVTLEILRGTEKHTVKITPVQEGGEYKLGLSLRDGAAGIGTVTYYDPESGLFGGLGHGICSSDSQEPVKMAEGAVYGVILGGAKKGEVGKPGELCGVLTNDAHGELYSNTDCGVFGKLEKDFLPERGTLEIAHRSEVHEGDATIISTLKNGKKAEYSVKIFDVDTSSTGTKSFKIKVNDDALTALTGGIVRGMSGSPIIQDGKLVGAVTHVLVANPTEGYGIFIENMLNAAEAPQAKVA